jgi:hypothetical protein
VVHLSITSPAITTAATVIPGTDINITIDEFTIVPPTIVGTITAALDIIDTITGTMVIELTDSENGSCGDLVDISGRSFSFLP